MQSKCKHSSSHGIDSFEVIRSLVGGEFGLWKKSSTCFKIKGQLELLHISLLGKESSWFPFGPNWKQTNYFYAPPLWAAGLGPAAWKNELTALTEA